MKQYTVKAGPSIVRRSQIWRAGKKVTISDSVFEMLDESIKARLETVEPKRKPAPKKASKAKAKPAESKPAENKHTDGK